MPNKICKECKEEIMSNNPEMCPYCFSTNLMTEEDMKSLKLENIAKLEKAGRFEEAAIIYEQLGMREKAGNSRRKGKIKPGVSANLKIGKIDSISMNCPYCNASQPLESKTSKVFCSYCKKQYIIPKKVRDLL